jgi:hypothetical protein
MLLEQTLDKLNAMKLYALAKALKERKRAGVAHGGGFARVRRWLRHNEHTTSVYRRSRWTGQRGKMRLCRYGSL